MDMNEEHETALPPGGRLLPRPAADAVYSARLNRLLRTAERMRTLAERMGGHIGDGQAGDSALDLHADAGELKSLADELVLLGYTFREAQLDPSLRSLATWIRHWNVGGLRAELRITGDALQLDHRLLPIMRERLQELILLQLDLAIAPARSRTPGEIVLHLDASVRGRSLVLTLHCDGLELRSAADLLPAAHADESPSEASDVLSRSAGRRIFHPSFASAWGLPPSWHERLLYLRDLLRRDRGDLQWRDHGTGRLGFALSLPLVADLAAVLVVRGGGATFALPVDAVFSTRLVAPSEWRLKSGQLWLDQALPSPAEGFEQADWASVGPVAVADIPGLLGDRPGASPSLPTVPTLCLLLEDGDGMGGLIVDEVVGERQILLRHPRSILRRVRTLMGSFLLPAEEVCVILHPWDLLQCLRDRSEGVDLPSPH